MLQLLLYFIKLVFIFHCKLLVREYTKNRITYIFNTKAIFILKLNLMHAAYIDITTQAFIYIVIFFIFKKCIVSNR